MNTKRSQQFCLILASLLSVAGLTLSAGCQHNSGNLSLTDLTPPERLYCERVIALERARTVALIHRETGETLLDSLATAWGDSVKPETLDGLSPDPRRSVAVGELLLRVLKAEQDSLRWDPGHSRLHLPLPDPDRPGRQRPVLPDSTSGAAVPRI